MSDTKKSNKYNACLNIQVGPNKELIVAGKTINLIENGHDIVINATAHTLNLKTGERIDKSGKQDLKKVAPEVLTELRKVNAKKTGKQGASR